MAVQYGSMVKRMNHGRSAQNGLYAALLASAGYTGIKNVFECEYGGFCTTFSRQREWIKWEELTKGLGESWETMMDSLKFYSAAASNHTTLDAIRIMRERKPFSADDVERIVVHGSQVTKDTTVCLIEAMKVYNEIKAEVDGVIERIAVKNADPVEYGQPLFFVRPT